MLQEYSQEIIETGEMSDNLIIIKKKTLTDLCGNRRVRNYEGFGLQLKKSVHVGSVTCDSDSCT